MIGVTEVWLVVVVAVHLITESCYVIDSTPFLCETKHKREIKTQMSAEESVLLTTTLNIEIHR